MVVMLICPADPNCPLLLYGYAYMETKHSLGMALRQKKKTTNIYSGLVRGLRGFKN